jgi:anthranilate 1,2-dioxygenase small subunit
MIVQTNKSGESKLFCAGCYEDRIKVGAGRARFVERIAVLDTFSIPSMLATPV